MPLKFDRNEPVTEQELQDLAEYEEDLQWLSDHASEIEQAHRGKYVAVANQQLFVADSYEDAEAQAKAAFPDRQPVVEYIPYKRRVMV